MRGGKQKKWGVRKTKEAPQVGKQKPVHIRKPMLQGQEDREGKGRLRKGKTIPLSTSFQQNGSVTTSLGRTREEKKKT